jgi:hypothetical protein
MARSSMTGLICRPVEVCSGLRPHEALKRCTKKHRVQKMMEGIFGVAEVATGWKFPFAASLLGSRTDREGFFCYVLCFALRIFRSFCGFCCSLSCEIWWMGILGTSERVSEVERGKEMKRKRRTIGGSQGFPLLQHPEREIIDRGKVD